MRHVAATNPAAAALSFGLREYRSEKMSAASWASSFSPDCKSAVPAVLRSVVFGGIDVFCALVRQYFAAEARRARECECRPWEL